MLIYDCVCSSCILQFPRGRATLSAILLALLSSFPPSPDRKLVSVNLVSFPVCSLPPPRSLPDTLHASITALRQEDDRDVFCGTNKADEEHFAKFSWVQVRWWVTLRQAPEWTWTVLTKKRNDDRVTFPSWLAPQSRRRPVIAKRHQSRGEEGQIFLEKGREAGQRQGENVCSPRNSERGAYFEMVKQLYRDNRGHFLPQTYSTGPSG